MLKSYQHKVSFCATLLLLAGVMVFVGCVSFDLPDLQRLINQYASQASETVRKFGSAASDYYQCCGKWPASLDELQSTNCLDAQKRQEISDLLAGIQWNAISNVLFTPTNDGYLAISVGIKGGTISTNGTSVTWNDGGSVTTMVEIPSKN
jgi:hypothetical protein